MNKAGNSSVRECATCDGEGVPASAVADHDRCCPDFRTEVDDRDPARLVTRCLSCGEELPPCQACADYSPGRARPEVKS